MAANPKPDAKTTIDSLTELLKEKGRIELGKAAATLGINPTIVENWAKVLEKGNMVRITYEVGKMYIEPVSVSKEQERAIEATVEAERSTIASTVAQERASLEQLTLELGDIDLTVKSAEKVFQERFPIIEKELDEINSIYKALETENTKVESIKKGAQGTYDDLNRKITALYSKIEGVDANTTQLTLNKLASIREELKKAQELENQLNLLSRSKDRALEAIKKSVEDQLRNLEKEIDRSRKNINLQLQIYSKQIEQALKEVREQERNVRDLSSQVSSFRRERESAKKSLEEARTSFNDQFIKTFTDMENRSSILSRETKSILSQLNTVKEGFGQASKVYDAVQKAKIEVATAQKAVAALHEETDKLLSEVTEIEAMKASAEAKAAKAAEIKNRVASMGDSRKKLEEDTKSAAEDMARAAKGEKVDKDEENKQQ